jgi:hypothetical protein
MNMGHLGQNAAKDAIDIASLREAPAKASYLAYLKYKIIKEESLRRSEIFIEQYMLNFTAPDGAAQMLFSYSYNSF